MKVQQKWIEEMFIVCKAFCMLHLMTYRLTDINEEDVGHYTSQNFKKLSIVKMMTGLQRKKSRLGKVKEAGQGTLSGKLAKTFLPVAKKKKKKKH